jgi:hypothetical protein
MTLTIDCTCGAHLEIDGRFAGQTIQCPDCQRALQVPTYEPVVVRTSGLALASFMLALIGAFTVVGTLAAVVLGALGLRAIAKNPGRLQGNGYALAGIVMGLLFTAVSLFAYARVEMFGMDRVLRERRWAGKLKFEEGSQASSEGGFSIPVLSKSWGILTEKDLFQAEPAHSIILVNVRGDAYAIGFSFGRDQQMEDKVETYREAALAKFGESRLVRLLAGRKTGLTAPQVVSTTPLPKRAGRESEELTIELDLGKHERVFLMRIIPGQDSLFVVAAGTSKRTFSAVENELRQIVSGFKLHEGPAGF